MIRALLAALLLIFELAACGDRERPGPVESPSPALWAIESADGAVLGWLFGTVHALPDGVAWRTSALDQAIEQAGVMVVEVRDLDPRRTAALFERIATDEPVVPLAERLPVPARARLDTLLRAAEVPNDRFDRLETWAAALALSRLGGTSSAANGADKALMQRFPGGPIVELEGAAAQLAIFDRLPERDQRRLLTAVLAERSDPAGGEQALARAWLAGDLRELESITRRGLLADPALYEALAAGRNRAWVNKLVPLLQGGRRPLIAVGTAHMLGSDGLPALLGQRDFRLRRIQ